MGEGESLLYSGYQDLKLTRIFIISIFIGASAAIMGLSIDIPSCLPILEAALLMMFMAQGTPLDHIFNYKYEVAQPCKRPPSECVTLQFVHIQRETFL